MKFKDIIQRHLITEGRSESLSREKTVKILRNNCQKAVKEYDQIWRGYKYEPFDGWHGYVDPRKYTRQSKNTENYYTLLLDNLPQWKNFPKRSKSVICSTSEDKAGDFGVSYHIIPFDNAKIGICPKSDIWNSFDSSLYEVNITNLYQLNDYLGYSIRKITNDIAEEYSYKRLKDQLEQVTISSIESYEQNNKRHKSLNKIKKVLYNTNSSDAYQALSKTLTSDNFNLANPGDLLPNNREVWTEGPCVILHPIAIDEGILDEV